jgi:hypothetical protein
MGASAGVCNGRAYVVGVRIGLQLVVQHQVVHLVENRRHAVHPLRAQHLRRRWDGLGRRQEPTLLQRRHADALMTTPARRSAQTSTGQGAGALVIEGGEWSDADVWCLCSGVGGGSLVLVRLGLWSRRRSSWSRQGAAHREVVRSDFDHVVHGEAANLRYAAEQRVGGRTSSTQERAIWFRRVKRVATPVTELVQPVRIHELRGRVVAGILKAQSTRSPQFNMGSAPALLLYICRAGS